MPDAPSRFVVITGGPGSGKSTLTDALKRAGHRASQEVGRSIIQAQMAIGGQALPWIDPVLFAEMMLSWEMQSYHREAARPGPVFFDRGVPDVIGY
jgi:predicted ATPase